MTQEEKAKRYDELLLKLQKAKVDDNVCDEMYYRVIDDIVPELKESEDEKVRKEILDCFRAMKQQGCFPSKHKEQYESWIAWLEKQGEQKQEEKPRYNIGDIICDKSCTTLNKEAQPNMEIIDIRNGMYICDKGSFPVSQQDEYELVGKRIGSKLNDDSVSNELRAASFAHAEREMKNQTFPDNLEFELIYTFEEGAKWNAAQKSAWSEEDEGILDEIIDFLENGTVKLQHDLSLYASWLKSLKDRYAWRASWEQLDALEYHLKHTNENSRLYKETKKLYDQLKKL